MTIATTPACPRIQTAPGALELSRIVAGMWRMPEWGMSAQRHVGFIEACLELGVSSFDHADIYGDYGVEAMFGDALRLQPSLRARIELVSKCGIKLVSKRRPAHTIQHYDTSAAHIVASAEQSLRLLGTDYLDLLLIHRPDPLMDFDELARTFEGLRQAGKVRHFGVSNFSRHQFDCLNKRIALSTNQVEFSPLHTAPLFDETFDGLQDAGVAPMIWSPLAGGRLFDLQDERAGAVRAVAADIAARQGVSVVAVVLAWVMQLPCRPLALTGSGRIAALAEAVGACAITLERADWFRILRAARGHEVA
ncbi:MAG: aldo/keto reductase [Pseudomonadota bacterium]